MVLARTAGVVSELGHRDRNPLPAFAKLRGARHVQCRRLDSAIMATVLTWHSGCARVGVGLRVHRRSPLVERLLLAGGLNALAIGWPNEHVNQPKGAAS